MTILTATEYPEFAAITGRACRKCGAVKPLGQFSRAPKGKYGRKASCKACDASRYAAKPMPSRALPAEELAARKAARRAVKTCTRCGQAKPRDQYGHRNDPRHPDYTDGVDPWCLTCVDTEFINDDERAEMAALGLVGQPCECGCGETTKVDVRRKRVGKWLSGHNSKVDHPLAGKGRHNMEGTPTYTSWSAMVDRCRNPNATAYARYGGRGITVCERWLDFVNFLEDMGVRPEGTTIDRIDGSGNYEPGNCRWADWYEQAANRSNTKLTDDDVAWIRVNPEGLPKAEVAARMGVSVGHVNDILADRKRSKRT